jgi:predicted DCC family thiol-disulfide oxidoreductase YuxK
MAEQNIIFFDGVCGLCNGTVDFVLREDRARIFLYSPLQGETFRKIAPEYPETIDANSLFVLRRDLEKHTLLKRSEAILYILDHIPRYRWLGRGGRIFPVPIRDAIYRLIAATRYQIWGKRDSCRLPTSEESARFLP